MSNHSGSRMILITFPSLKTLLRYFHQSADCTTPASPDLFHTAVLICAQIHTLYVAMYQISGLVYLTSTAVFTIRVYFSMCANIQNRSAWTNWAYFSTAFFHGVSKCAFQKMVSVHCVSTSWNWPGDTRSKRFSVNYFTSSREKKFLQTNETFCTKASVWPSSVQFKCST